MAVFNLNTGEITESTSYTLSNSTYFDNILFTLKDNDDKIISPRYLRDSFLSLWSSTPFKETFATGSTISYIGIDSIDPSDRDIKRRVFIGKRSFSGTNSYIPSHDIMNPTLLIGASSSDIFLFNTKSDHVINTTTKIAILAGKISSNYIKAPYIQSQYVSGASPSLSIDFVAIDGLVDIRSNYDDLTINNIIMPSILETMGSASNNTTFFYDNGKLILDQIRFPNTSTIGTSSESLNIIGSEVNLNGYPLEFTSIYDGLTFYTPKQIGGIKSGSTFNHVSISDMLRRIIYPYLPPYVTIEIDNNYAEIGTTPSPNISFKIYKKTNSTNTAGLINMIPGTYPGITSSDHVVREGTAKGLIFSPPINSNQTNFTISVGDDVQIATASTFIKGIYPYFYGTSDSLLTQSDLVGLTKKVEYLSDKLISIEVTQDMIDSGNNWFYFIYDNDYPNLVSIEDENNNIISFTSSNRTFISPNGLWTTKSFKVYKWEVLTPISPSLNYDFKY